MCAKNTKRVDNNVKKINYLIFFETYSYDKEFIFQKNSNNKNGAKTKM